MQVDFMILADAAQVAGGKLYVMGGGWDTIVTKQFPLRRQLAIAIAFLVPWDQTNERHDFELTVVSEDGRAVLPPMCGQLEVGRPPGIKQGTVQRGIIAVGASVEFASAGRYEVRLSTDSELVKTAHFDVVQGKAK